MKETPARLTPLRSTGPFWAVEHRIGVNSGAPWLLLLKSVHQRNWVGTVLASNIAAERSEFMKETPARLTPLKSTLPVMP